MHTPVPARLLPPLLAACVTLLLTVAAQPAQARSSTFAEAAVDAVVVRAESPAHLDGLQRYAEQRGYRVTSRSDALGALRLDTGEGDGVVRTMAVMLRAEGAIYVEPLYRATTADIPADPLYATRQRRYLEPVGAHAAWDIEQGRASTIVAVIDTGVDGAHPDLQGRMWVNAGETPANGVDDDDNGCVDDVHGCAFVAFPESGCAAREGGAAGDDSGHGTFVAGIIAANANNGQGIAGVARGASIMAVKVLDCAGGGNSLQVAQGIVYAAENGARIINVSLGGSSDPLIVREAVRTATEQYGALVVAATGNSGDSGVTYPARYPEVLAVGAASIADPTKRADFSTYGPEVDVAAIGESIVGPLPQAACGRLLPCLPGGPYAAGSGTSFAAPQVAGLAALIVSRQPAMTPPQLIALIKASAVPVPAGEAPNWAGAGLIDMAEALPPQFRLGTPGTARN